MNLAWTPPAAVGPMLGFGQVRHARLKPQAHAFAYPTYFLMLPMRHLQAHGGGALALNRRAALSFHDTDHGDGRSPAEGGSLAWLLELLAREGIDDADGEVWLHCYPRVLGYAFKPVSFWYCHRADHRLRAIVVEVNNTFGERHCYLLPTPQWGAEQTASKVFHVSPFCHIEGIYRFRFMRTQRADGERTVVRIDHDDAQGPLLQTSVSGQLEPVSAHSLRRAIWQFPLMTWGVIARIHWQALKLWWQRIPYVPKPHRPSQFVTR
jgi:DUF1365 family protein